MGIALKDGTGDLQNVIDFSVVPVIYVDDRFETRYQWSTMVID